MSHNSIQRLMSLSMVMISLTLLSQLSVLAQRSRMSIDDRVKNLTEQLSLTSVQADSVRKIYESTDKERASIFEAHRGDRSAMRESMAKLMSDTDKKIEALLTEKQQKKYEEIMKDRQNRRGGSPGDREHGTKTIIE